jgi:hypothetical protein
VVSESIGQKLAKHDNRRFQVSPHHGSRRDVDARLAHVAAVICAVVDRIGGHGPPYPRDAQLAPGASGGTLTEDSDRFEEKWRAPELTITGV